MWSLVLMFFIGDTSFANGDFKVECPEAIQVDERLASKHPLWEGAADNGYGQFGYRLQNVGFYYGHPKYRASMVPTDTTDKKTVRKSTRKSTGSPALTATPSRYWCGV